VLITPGQEGDGPQMIPVLEPDTITESELGEDAGDVRFDGRLGQVETGGQFGVAQSSGRQAEDLQFARGERGEVAVEGGGVAAALGEPLHEAAGDRGREESVAGTDRADAAVSCSGVTSLRRKPLAPADSAA
jgi:hypothetical protein